ncbi:unnamed protein product [Thelazia callipaeda]|uniref:Ovule protein n=1 Tax=Thelazia callipaeda TaxID=103827 RepID=A0A0N5CT87_THECL|nr:unnamed protein product [Thelazia callipaeda]
MKLNELKILTSNKTELELQLSLNVKDNNHFYIMIKILRTVFKQPAIMQGPSVWPIIGNLHQIHLKPDG